jgi:hypothetical protein
VATIFMAMMEWPLCQGRASIAKTVVKPVVRSSESAVASIVSLRKSTA